MKSDWPEARRKQEHLVIRQRIRVALLEMGILAVIWAILAGFVYSMEQGHLQREVDRQLVLESQSLSKLVKVRPGSGDVLTPLDVHAIIWSKSLHIVAQYQPFPAPTLPALRHALMVHQSPLPTYYSLTVVGIPYRVRQWTVAGHRHIQVFDDIQDDQSRLATILGLFIWGGVIGLILSLVGGFLMGLWTLRPIFQARRREQTFLSDVAHELRTPLAAINAQVELLLRHVDDPIGMHLPWIETVYSEMQRMTRLVNDLLEVGRLEEGRSALTLEPVSLRQVGEAVDSIYRPVLEEAGLELMWSIPVDAVVLADAWRLRQLLLIFLDNAKKHTQRGQITVFVVVRGNHVELHVKDTGDGMPVAKPSPARSAHGRTIPSTGLGLVIARKIIRAHGASLAMHSLPGVGTEVVVTFRRAVRRKPSSPDAGMP